MYSHETLAVGAKPCPFCGNKDITVLKKEFFDENGLRVLYLECDECGCKKTGGVYDDYEGAFESALEGWNRRAYESRGFQRDPS